MPRFRRGNKLDYFSKAIGRLDGSQGAKFLHISVRLSNLVGVYPTIGGLAAALLRRRGVLDIGWRAEVA
jgi:hypothetical protein